MGTNTTLSNFLIIASLSSSSLINSDYLSNNLFPQKNISGYHLQASMFDWKDMAFNTSGQYTILDEETEKIDIMLHFTKNLLTTSVDLESEIIDLVNENFWNLL